MKPVFSRFRRHLALIMAGAALLCGCNYARMNNDEAVDLYESEMPETPSGAIPRNDGLNALKLVDLEKLSNPLAGKPDAVVRGRAAYLTYCHQCHGPEARGFGTVGQSFAPLPTDLHGKYVQSQSDGIIYARITLGYRRHPPMFSTVSERDRWALVSYIRSLGPG